jgi:hypothetical protein
MKTAAALLLACLLAGCATAVATITGDDGGWLIGSWCADREAALPPAHFFADGRYTTVEGSGYWAYRDRSLRILRRSGGRPLRIDRVEQLGATAMAWTLAGGQRETWHRCYAAP